VEGRSVHAHAAVAPATLHRRPHGESARAAPRDAIGVVCDRTNCGVGAHRGRGQRACAKGARVVRAAVKVWVADSFNSDIPPSTHPIDIEAVSSSAGARLSSRSHRRGKSGSAHASLFRPVLTRCRTLGARARGPYRALIRRT
jgi:hypothetical protein